MLSTAIIIGIVITAILVVLCVFSSIFDMFLGAILAIGGGVFKFLITLDDFESVKTEYFTNHGITDLDIYAYVLMIAGGSLFLIGLIRYIIIKIRKNLKKKKENNNVTEPVKTEKVKTKKEKKAKKEVAKAEQQAETKKCPKCGNELNVNAKFCTKCGEKF